MTDKEVEDIIRSNMNLQMNLAGIRADFEEALAKEKQERVEWGVDWSKDGSCVSIIKRTPSGGIEVVAVEYGPQRTWVGLTDDEIDQGLLRSDYAFKTAEAWRAGVVFAMTKLKEKNT